jgi:hypothetical protein
MTVQTGTSLSATVIRQDTLDIQGTGTVTLRGGSKTTSVLNVLNIAGGALGDPNLPTATMDIGNKALVVQAAGDANVVYNRLVLQARYASDNQNWDLAGLTSTKARGDGNTGVAVVLNRDDSTGGAPAFMSSFDATPDANLAVSVDNRSILVKYTWYGDADLNGIVDERDLSRFSTGYADQRSASPLGLTGWAWGDFNNDGTIDERDLAMFSTAYANHGGPLSPGAVPEPGTLVLIGLGLAALRAGRRSRKLSAA